MIASDSTSSASRTAISIDMICSSSIAPTLASAVRSDSESIRVTATAEAITRRRRVRPKAEPSLARSERRAKGMVRG